MKWTDIWLNPDEPDPKKHVIFQQIGWIGCDGKMYEMDKKVDLTEPRLTPIYVQSGWMPSYTKTGRW